MIHQKDRSVFPYILPWKVFGVNVAIYPRFFRQEGSGD